MLKQKLILAVFSFAVLFMACNNDDNIGSTETYPVELSISFPEKDIEFQYQAWNEKKQIAVLRTDIYNAEKLILSQSEGQMYIGTSEKEIDEDTEFSLIYPISASTVSTNDTLTQTLNINKQNGTLAGLAEFDYIWGTYTYDTEDEDYTSTSIMTSLMSFCKFQFTENGRPIEHITQVIITSPSDSLHVVGELNMNDGNITSKNRGSIVIRNNQGLSEGVYAAFFPTETALHFTVSTLQGKSYEAILPKVMEFKKGSTFIHTDIACHEIAAARIGDYYYNDATWSTQLDESKTCVGIVYALDDVNRNLDKSLSASIHGRVVALKDCAGQVSWCASGSDIEGIENHTILQDTMYIGSLPYLNGTSDSFFSEDMLEQLDEVQIDSLSGQIIGWYSEGALSDFNGEEHALQIDKSSGTFYASSYCRSYGQGLYGWHPPSAGELALLWSLHRSGFLCNEKFSPLENFGSFGYWTSTEYDEGNAWYINFWSGVITKNSKTSSYNCRPVIRF